MKLHSQDRQQAILKAILEIEKIEQELSITQESLKQIENELLKIAMQDDLFSYEEFSITKGESGSVFCISENIDTHLGLYIVSDLPGVTSPPHSHHTWAAIAGIYGVEENTWFTPIQSHSKLEKKAVRITNKISVGPRMSVSMLEQDIHSTKTISDGPTLHLHVYGKPLHMLPPFKERVFQVTV